METTKRKRSPAGVRPVNRLPESVIPDRWVEVAVAAQYLGLSKSSIYNLMTAGQLAYGKFGVARRVRWSELERFAQANTVTA